MEYISDLRGSAPFQSVKMACCAHSKQIDVFGSISWELCCTLLLQTPSTAREGGGYEGNGSPVCSDSSKALSGCNIFKKHFFFAIALGKLSLHKLNTWFYEISSVNKMCLWVASMNKIPLPAPKAGHTGLTRPCSMGYFYTFFLIYPTPL